MVTVYVHFYETPWLSRRNAINIIRIPICATHYSSTFPSISNQYSGAVVSSKLSSDLKGKRFARISTDMAFARQLPNLFHETYALKMKQQRREQLQTCMLRQDIRVFEFPLSRDA
jgi:hypothetical protein